MAAELTSDKMEQHIRLFRSVQLRASPQNASIERREPEGFDNARPGYPMTAPKWSLRRRRRDSIKFSIPLRHNRLIPLWPHTSAV
jgi:hypothetical protein